MIRKWMERISNYFGVENSKKLKYLRVEIIERP